MANLNNEQIAELARQQATMDALAEQGQAMQGQPNQAAPQQGGGFFNDFVKPAAIPTALSIGGGMAFAPLGPWGSIAGASVGSGLGEGINQLTGITEPNLSKVSEAMFWPAAIGGAMQAGKAVMPLLTSGRAAQTLNALAPEEAAARVATMTPNIPASTLFKQATAQDVKIPMNRTLATIDNMIDDLSQSQLAIKTRQPVIAALNRLKAKLGAAGGKLSPAELQAELEGSGEMVAKLQAAGGKGSGASKQLFKAMTNDLDDAVKMANPAAPAALTLKAARDTFKKESVLKEIGEAITDATKSMRGQGGDVQFNASAVLNSLKKNDFYKTALSGKEQGEIESLLKLLNKIPALGPGSGAQHGFGRLGRSVVSGGVGGGIGMASGGPMGAGIGSAIGMAAPPILDFGKNVVTAMQMTTGRALMKELLTQSKGVATPQVASIIAAYAHAVKAGQVQQ